MNVDGLLVLVCDACQTACLQIGPTKRDDLLSGVISSFAMSGQSHAEPLTVNGRTKPLSETLADGERDELPSPSDSCIEGKRCSLMMMGSCLFGDQTLRHHVLPRCRRRSGSKFALVVLALMALASPVCQAQMTPSSPVTTAPPSQALSSTPSLLPSSSSSPSVEPTSQPTMSPSHKPSTSSIPTTSPTGYPSLSPTWTSPPSFSFFPTKSPSRPPSEPPSRPPTQNPTYFPTISEQPSGPPTSTIGPSLRPTESPRPTASPSNFPSITPGPTNEPSAAPTSPPSMIPSESPTPLPTFPNATETRAQFSQRFEIPELIQFVVPNETAIFEEIMESYTVNISEAVGDDPTRINTTCTVVSQQFESLGRRLARRKKSKEYQELRIETMTETQIGHNLRGRRRAQATILNRVGYTMVWSSIHANVSNYASLFQSLINGDPLALTDSLLNAGLNVTASRDVVNILPTLPPTRAPTVSSTPTMMPSLSPSTNPTGRPSWIPSMVPSVQPTISPTASPSRVTSFPSQTPSLTRPSKAPSIVPTMASENPSPAPIAASAGVNVTVIAVVVVGLVAGLLVAAFIFYRFRKRRKEIEFRSNAVQQGRRQNDHNNDGMRGFSQGRNSKLTVRTTDPYSGLDMYSTPKSDDMVVGMLSPSESILSNNSLLSAGGSMGGESVDEVDNTHHLADEFDQYKDQNLEQMRSEVMSNLNGADGMMSQAMTRALMDDEDAAVNPNELYWGGSGDATEIEASALCEVNDWLKRKGQVPGLEQRRAFMQDTMNKMVSSVRHGVLGPDQASRTIHECAAMLGLELAAPIPENSIIVSGMRKTVTRTDMIVAFREFGDIEDAAVSSNSRGFGLVRFVSTKSAHRAMNKFRVQEIVVQDVAVMVRVLKSEGSGYSVEAKRSTSKTSAGQATT